MRRSPRGGRRRAVPLQDRNGCAGVLQRARRRPGIVARIRGSKSAPAPANFPKVDAETQRGRDDLRRKVLTDELTAEEKLLADARAAYANGAPTPLPEERTNAAMYQERIARLRQSVLLHERNVEALRKELGNAR